MTWIVAFSKNQTELRAGCKYHKGWGVCVCQMLDLEALFWSAAGFSHSATFLRKAETERPVQSVPGSSRLAQGGSSGAAGDLPHVLD